MIYAHYVDEGPIGYTGDDPQILEAWTKLFVFKNVDDFRITRTAMEGPTWERKNAHMPNIFDDTGKFGDEVVVCEIVEVET